MLKASLVLITMLMWVSMIWLVSQPRVPALAGSMAPDTRPVLKAPVSILTVTSTADSGAGTLRQALTDANPGDTIEFNLSYPAAIVLTSGELIITKDLIINGPARPT
jgi:hypothetical protein